MSFNIRIHHLRFQLEALSQIHMGAQAGAQLRGALWNGLNNTVCTAPEERKHPYHAEYCPMCFLMELKANSPRGEDPPRPFALRPPMAVRAEEDQVFLAGERFEIQMSLMGKATSLFPYLVQGLREAGQAGVGYGRGRFRIVGIQAYHPYNHETDNLLISARVKMPSLCLERDSILDAAQKLPETHIRLRFLTATTLKHGGEILRRPQFPALIQRLLERAQALDFHYGENCAEPGFWKTLYENLSQAAENIRVTQDNTRWIQVMSGSRRSNYYQDIGGFVGEVRFEGDLEPFQEWLLWGQSLQVGKNVVKGSGAYEIAGD
jgi:hypothetical protein